MTKRRVVICTIAVALLLLWTGGTWAWSRHWYQVGCGRMGPATIDVPASGTDQTRSVTYRVQFCHYFYSFARHRWSLSCSLDSPYDFDLPAEMARYESDMKLAAADGFDRFVVPTLGAANCTSDKRASFIEDGGCIIRTSEGAAWSWVQTLGIGGVLISIAGWAAFIGKRPRGGQEGFDAVPGPLASSPSPTRVSLRGLRETPWYRRDVRPAAGE